MRCGGSPCSVPMFTSKPEWRRAGGRSCSRARLLQRFGEEFFHLPHFVLIALHLAPALGQPWVTQQDVEQRVTTRCRLGLHLLKTSLVPLEDQFVADLAEDRERGINWLPMISGLIESKSGPVRTHSLELLRRHHWGVVSTTGPFVNPNL